MALYKEQIEHMERLFHQDSDKPWQNPSYSRKWHKNQMNRYMRRCNKKITLEDVGMKTKRKPLKGWEY